MAARPAFPFGPPRAIGVVEPFLEFCAIDVLRGGRYALRDFSLEIALGEHVAIVGPNGAGKSTLLRLIARESYPVPKEGMVCRLLGRERWNVFELRSHFGIVGGETLARFEPDATVFDVVAGALASPDAQAVATALERLGLANLARRSIFELSSGEWRRTTIARALVHRPLALVLDEPSVSLDIVAQRDLRHAMRSLAREGVGIVLVTHHLEDVIPEIERIVFIKDGRLAADGPKADLFAPGPLQSLFGAGVVVFERDGTYSLAAPSP